MNLSQLDLDVFNIGVKPSGLYPIGGHCLSLYDFENHIGWSSDRYPDFGDDIFVCRADFHSFAVVTPPWPVSWCGNLNPYQIQLDASSRTYLTGKPANHRYSPDADHQRYANLLSTFSSVLQGALISAPPKTREQGVTHSAVKGIVSDSGWTDGPRIGYPGSHEYGWGPSWTSRTSLASSVNVFAAPIADKLDWQTSILVEPQPPYAVGVDLLGWLEAKLLWLSEHASPLQIDVNFSNIYEKHWTFKGGSLDRYPVNTGGFGQLSRFARFRASYDFWIREYDVDANLVNTSPKFHKDLDWSFWVRPSWGLRSSSETIWPLSQMLVVSDNTDVTSTPNASGVLGVSVQGNGFSVDKTLTPRAMYNPLSISSYDSPEFKEFFYSSGGTYLKKSSYLERLVELNMSHIRPSSFIAFSHALDENLLTLKANHLQNLQHLSDVLGLLPDLGKAGKLIAKLAAGDFSALPLALDLLTELILQYRFQQAPLSRDIQELAQLEIRAELESLTKPKTVTWRGVYKYDFLPEENFLGTGSLHLETHCEANLTMDLSTALSGIVAANSVGLLPNLSRLWSLVPFSFVVDWFTNESERLHLVDNQLLALFALRVHYCVHSYKVTWFPDSAELDTHGLMTDPLDPFRITYYQRELSLIMPNLRNSKFDFMRKQKGPDPIVVGSLVYQLSS